MFERFKKIYDFLLGRSDKFYTFVAEEDHRKYGLRPGALYRAPQELRGGAQHTTGKPVLVHDPAYGPVSNWRHMIPFTKVPEEYVVTDDKTGTTRTIPNAALSAIHLMDTVLALVAILVFAGIFVAFVA